MFIIDRSLLNSSAVSLLLSQKDDSGRRYNVAPAFVSCEGMRRVPHFFCTWLEMFGDRVQPYFFAIHPRCRSDSFSHATSIAINPTAIWTPPETTFL